MEWEGFGVKTRLELATEDSSGPDSGMWDGIQWDGR